VTGEPALGGQFATRIGRSTGDTPNSSESPVVGPIQLALRERRAVDSRPPIWRPAHRPAWSTLSRQPAEAVGKPPPSGRL